MSIWRPMTRRKKTKTMQKVMEMEQTECRVACDVSACLCAWALEEATEERAGAL